MFKKWISLVLSLIIVSTSVFGSVTYAEDGYQSVSNQSIAKNEQMNYLTFDAVMQKYNVSEDWVNEEVSKGYSLYQIYSALKEGGQEQYSAQISKFNPFEAIEQDHANSLIQDKKTYSHSTQSFSLNNLAESNQIDLDHSSTEYDEAALQHLTLSSESALYNHTYDEDEISAATGDLKLYYNDFSLPGALPFTLTRVYDSARGNEGIGVVEKNGAYFNDKYTRQEEIMAGLGRGWRWQLPFIDKQNQVDILDFPGVGRYVINDNLTLEGYPWSNLKFATDSSKIVNGQNSELKLSVLNGNQFYFSPSGQLLLITDNYGNKVEFHYTTFGEGQALSKITNSDGNTLLFTYTTGQTTVELTGTDQKMQYIKKEEYKQPVLAEVKNGLNLSTKYVYTYPESRFNFLKSLSEQEEQQPVKYSSLLSRIIAPSSGIKEFKYVPGKKKTGEYATDFVFKISLRRSLYSTTTEDKILKSHTFKHSEEDLNSFGQLATWNTTMQTSNSKQIMSFSKIFTSAKQPDLVQAVTHEVQDDNMTYKQQYSYDQTKLSNVPIQTTSSYIQGGQESKATTVNYEYNDQGLLDKENWSTGQETLYKYTASDEQYFWYLPNQVQVKLKTDQSRLETIGYNSQGSVIQTTIRENTASGKLLTQKNFEYDAYGNIATVSTKDDKRVNKVTNTYSSEYGKHLLTESSSLIHSIDGRTSESKQAYTYNPDGDIKTATDEAGKMTVYEYDALGRPIRTTYSDQSTESVVYQDILGVVTNTSVDGVVTIRRANPLGLLTEQSVDDAVIKYRYDQEGNLQNSIDAEQNETEYSYDGFGLLTQTKYADGTIEQINYDMINRIKTYRDPSGVTHQIRFDELGRTVATEELKAGNYHTLEQVTYDLEGNTLTVTDGNGNLTSYNYDALGRTTSVIDQEGKTTKYTYSLAGDLIKTHYADNSYIEKEYNERGQVIRQMNEHKLAEIFYYDNRGNLTRMIDHASQFTEYQYNDDNLLTSITAPDQQITYTYNSTGNRTQMSDETGLTKYSYDPKNGSLHSINYPDGTVINYSYDKQMRNGYTLTDSKGKSTGAKYTFDSLNRISELNIVKANSSQKAMLMTQSNSSSQIKFNYQANGLLKQAVLGNGVTTDYQYSGYDLRQLAVGGNATTRVQSLRTSTEEGTESSLSPSAGQAFSYEYDGNKNIVSRTQNADSETFAYDNLNRIQSESGENTNKKYDYDERGNRLNVEGQKIKGLTNADFTFDSLNRLIQYKGENDTIVKYRYNGDGLLYERTEEDKITRYYYDIDDNLIAEGNVSNGKSDITYTYIYDLSNQLWARVEHATEEVQYYQFNGHGDIVGLTDSQGNQLNSYTYDIWGNPEQEEGDTPNIFRYSGEYWDETTQLQYLRARWYDPNTGRFISKDTYEGSLESPLSQNLYTYVENNPLTHVDPSGHKPTLLEAATMADHVYKVKSRDIRLEKKLDGGWIIKEIKTNSEGLKIGIYYRYKRNGKIEYAVVNKGTGGSGALKTTLDWINNIQQPAGASDDMKDSIKFAKQFNKVHLIEEVTMIGHSKGGAEAAANAVATNRNAILFNPAAVALELYGLKASSYSAKMTAYVVRGEALDQAFGSSSEPIGKKVYLPIQYRVNYKWNVFKNISNSIKNHSMESVITALKQEGYN